MRKFRLKRKKTDRKKTYFNRKNDSKNVKDSRLLKVFLYIIVVGILLSLLRFLFLQAEELSQLKFATDMQYGIKECDLSVDYDPDSVFTLLILSDFGIDDKLTLDGAALVQLDYNSPEVRIISMHPDIYFRPYNYEEVLSSSYGVTLVRVRDLMVLGHLQTPPVSLAYAFYQLQEFLAIPIDGYVYISGDADEVSGLGIGYPPSEAVSGTKEYGQWSREWSEYWIDNLDSISVLNIWSSREDIPRIESNMSAVELYEFIKAFQRVNGENIDLIPLSQDNLAEVVDERGKTVSFLSEVAVDEVLKDFTGDVRMDREQARVEIFNGSSVNGLGNRYRRWIDHIGGDVIRVENAPGVWETSVIYVTDLEEFEYTVGNIVSLWTDGVEIIEGRPDFVTTGDVIVVLGIDF